MNNETKRFHYRSMTIHLHPQVYEPAEDTFLLLESIQIKKNQKIFEIGSGTGIIALSCAQQGANVICSDINPYAIALIKKNIDENIKKLKGLIEVRKGNLYEPVKNNERFDIIIFNPPYLPTTKEQLIGGDGWYDKALDGGKTGLKITKPFLRELRFHLTNNGVAYFIYSSLSDKTLLTTIFDKESLQATTINTLRCDDELLEVIKISF